MPLPTACTAAGKGLTRGCLGGFGCLLTAHHLCHFVREHDLCIVYLCPFECFETRNLVEREVGEELEELADIAVVGVSPILPEIVSWQLFLVEPDGASGGFAHLRAVGGCEKRGRQPV